MAIILGLSLGLTLLFELPVAWVWGLRGRDLTLAVLVNVLTNPAVVLLHQFFPAWGATLALEVGAVLVEGWYYQRFGLHTPRPWLLSLSANALSFGAGLLINLFL